MASNTDNSPAAWHDQGQTDSSNGEYNPPPSNSVVDLIVDLDSTLDSRNERREAYDQGYEHTKTQK
jgi:hypothetical protein